jgi:sulfoxide reductase heme-binding subunit YedZ
VRKSLIVFGFTLILAGGSVLSYLTVAGSDTMQMNLMLRLSAWTALLIYLLVFIARPMNQLVNAPLSSKLLQNRRYYGVALAAVMTVHLVLLLVVNEQAFKIGGAIVYALLFLMLLTSFDGAAARIGPRNWRLLHKAGLYSLGIGYATAIGREFLQAPLDPVYLTLTILMLVAIAIRVTACVR